MPVPIYLEWEIKFNNEYLKGSLQRFVPFAEFWDVCVRNKVKITVNQLRKLAGDGAHPDGLDPSRAVNRGELFVFEDAPDEPGDSQVPQAIGKVFWDRKVKELGNADLVEGRESGGLSLEELKKEFPELAKLAGV